MSHRKSTYAIRSLILVSLGVLLCTVMTPPALFAAEHATPTHAAAPAAPAAHDAGQDAGQDTMPGDRHDHSAMGHGPATMEHEHADMFRSLTRAVCVLVPTEGSSVQGVVRFTQTDAGLEIVADVSGLNPGQDHGFHIHQYGDITAGDGTSAGGHYNPEGHDHALPQPDGQPRHAGDLGNLQADDTGHAHLAMVVDNLSVAGLVNPIIGRGMIVHAKADDGGQPTGNAGARIAMGVIGIAASE